MASATLTLVVGALAIFVVYLINKYSFWKRHGVPTAKGLVPTLGHVWPVVSLKTSISEVVRRIYNEANNSSMVGYYKITTPVLMVREPQLVKTILQTDLPSFHENGLKVDPDLDPLASANPFFNYGEVWMAARKRLTYAFSGKRLKILFVAVTGVCKKLEDFLDKHLKSGKTFEVELKSLFSRYTGEVVANAGLGIEGHCFEDKPHPGSFDEMGKLMVQPNLANGFVVMIFFFMPVLGKILRVPFVPRKLVRFIRQVIAENLKIRRESQIPRNDFLQTMIELEKDEGKKMNQEILTADALSFFVDGYETSSITLSFVGYQLAVHQDIQEKLRDEVTSTIAKHGGTLTYDGLKEMTYMDKVMSESQRTYPAVGFLTKLCTQEFEFEGSDGLRCRVKPGTEVIVPIHGLHLDPKYWTNPEVFDPERFDSDRKQSIDKMTFLPFGEGPRMCVGMRMAVLQMKACLATLLRGYKLELSPKTQLPLRLSSAHFLTSPIGGLWVKISKI
ncbi:cytochrome P450 9e2-like [Colletes latitarsis]|uniref:cytochrome P450 9e2-like n=1 Tax=Colletes latitarsis TaxID=2605962 RepID=UPI004036014A